MGLLALSAVLLIACALQAGAPERDWHPFLPAADAFGAQSGFDLRGLNEAFAGENGRILARDGRFIHETTGKSVRFWAVNGPPESIKDPAELRRFVDRAGQKVRSTHGQLRLDYGRGTLVIDAPAAQGASGNLAALGTVRTSGLTISSSMDLGHVVAVSLDGRPLAKSGRILLQVMSEERNTGFATEPGGGLKAAASRRTPNRTPPNQGFLCPNR